MYTRDEFYIIAAEAQCWLESIADCWHSEGVDEEDIAAAAEAAAALECLVNKAPKPMPWRLQLLQEKHREDVAKAIRRAERRAMKVKQREAA
jgi:hypothetical protein